jgi:N-acetylglucosaminyldiphosphoundecaprenol N-acetyl-beta-D-mannosaminyltransferase
LAVPTERVVERATSWLEGRAASVDFLGIPVCTLDLQGAVDLIDSAIRARQSLQIGVINAAKVANMATDPVLRNAVLSSDVIFADGISVVWASRLLGAPLPARVAGIDLMMALLARGKERRYRVFCLGATEAISARTVEIIERDFPGVIVAGRHHGYYSNEDEAKVVDLIAAARPDLLFVAMTSPKKENFLAKWGARLNTLVTHGVGGSFDVLAGHVQRAPRAWQALGLEWLYRVLQEPRRLWKRYFVTNIAFCGLVGRALIGRLVRRRI